MTEPGTSPTQVKVFSTCPPSSRHRLDQYLKQVERVSRWSDDHGCEGILVYTDNSLVDPWIVAREVLGVTSRLSPLVAVQPMYLHPYAVAKLITTLGNLHERRVHLNMVAGGFKNDLVSLGDVTPHDQRYQRLREYTSIILDLCRGAAPVTVHGDFYTVTDLKLGPPLPEALFPGVLVSGSSDAGRDTARTLGAVAIQYPQPAQEYRLHSVSDDLPEGIRVGIIARDDPEEAWRVAHERFPADRRGQITHALAMKTSDSHWHRQLSRVQEHGEGGDSPYWMFPFKNYKTFCPYLVGTYERVGAELARYLTAGFRTIILDVPLEEEDLLHTRAALEHAGATF